MRKKDLERFKSLNELIHGYADEEGLKTKEIVWEFCNPGKMWEAASTGLPTNFSFWYHGRLFDEARMKHEQGMGEIYEIVFNYENPYALLSRTNSLALNLLVAAHVRGHVDFNLRNVFIARARKRVDISHYAREAAERFDEYYRMYGTDAVEKVIEAGYAVRECMSPNPHHEFEEENIVRQRLIEAERRKIAKIKEHLFIKRDQRRKQVEEVEERIKGLKKKTPPAPEYDVLGYLLRHSSREHEPYVLDILNVIYEEFHHLAPISRCHILNEGWASYWHEIFMRRLFEEKHITDEEFGDITSKHAGVLTKISGRMAGFNFNPYFLGRALWEDLRDRWDHGQFGMDYLENRDPLKRTTWQKSGHSGEGKKKIFEVSELYDDRMAVSDPNIFSDEFIRHNELFVWGSVVDAQGDQIVTVLEDHPDVIRHILTLQRTNYGRPLIAVVDGNYKGRGELYLRHDFHGTELDPRHEISVLEYLYFIYGNTVHLETAEIVERNVSGAPTKIKAILHTYNGNKHSFDEEKPQVFSSNG